MKNTKDNHLQIYQNYMELIYYTNNLVRKYPKSENFTLVTEIKQTLYIGLRNLMYAIKVFKIKDKLNYLHELDINLSLLRIHIRLSYKYKYISETNYTYWSKLITEICNMLGGWINSCQKK